MSCQSQLSACELHISLSSLKSYFQVVYNKCTYVCMCFLVENKICISITCPHKSNYLGISSVLNVGHWTTAAVTKGKRFKKKTQNMF